MAQSPVPDSRVHTPVRDTDPTDRSRLQKPPPPTDTPSAQAIAEARRLGYTEDPLIMEMDVSLMQDLRHGLQSTTHKSNLQEYVWYQERACLLTYDTGVDGIAAFTHGTRLTNRIVPDLAIWDRAGMPAEKLTQGTVQYAEHGAPTLVYEALSATTADLDQSDKLLIYARMGVTEHWLYDLRAETRDTLTVRLRTEDTPSLAAVAAQQKPDVWWHLVPPNSDGSLFSPWLGTRVRLNDRAELEIWDPARRDWWFTRIGEALAMGQQEGHQTGHTEGHAQGLIEGQVQNAIEALLSSTAFFLTPTDQETLASKCRQELASLPPAQIPQPGDVLHALQEQPSAQHLTLLLTLVEAASRTTPPP